LDVITELSDEGTDTVQSSVSYALNNDVENLTLTGATAINATGNNLANRLLGNAASNILYGGLGNDILQGGNGNDVYIINNLFEYTSAEINDTAGVDEIRFTSTGNYQTLELFAGDTGIDKVVIGTGTGLTAVTTGITNLNIIATNSANALTIIGNNGNNLLVGTGFGDNIQGGAGDDVLNGGVGIDTLIGGAGNDTYYVDYASDIVTELTNAGIDTVQSSAASYTLSVNVENLTLIDAATNGTGNASANIITGNSYENILDGGLGNDTLIGGAGNDHFVFNVTLNTSTNVDTINDFVTNEDKIDLMKIGLMTNLVTIGSTLNSSDFLVSNQHSSNTSEHLIFDTLTHGLYYNADGNGVGAPLLFAILIGITNADQIHASDFAII
jgi:Ca2+-binding RTX toxin-like protein